MKGYEEDRQRETANRYIDLVGLGGFENNYPNELSGGMQQRVGIARALSVDPEVLLMDEPFGALDAQTRQLMQEELLQIWEMEKKTVLFVTHDLDEAILLADRILVMGTNPRTIQGEWDIPFDRPRYDRDIEGTDEFARIKGEIWSTLKKDIKIEES
jgi:NitT/TauT family transport system ATP-binding protein